MKRIKFRHGSCAVGLAVNFSFSLSLSLARFCFFLRWLWPRDVQKSLVRLFAEMYRARSNRLSLFALRQCFCFSFFRPEEHSKCPSPKMNHNTRRGNNEVFIASTCCMVWGSRTLSKSLKFIAAAESLEERRDFEGWRCWLAFPLHESFEQQQTAVREGRGVGRTLGRLEESWDERRVTSWWDAKSFLLSWDFVRVFAPVLLKTFLLTSTRTSTKLCCCPEVDKRLLNCQLECNNSQRAVNEFFLFHFHTRKLHEKNLLKFITERSVLEINNSDTASRAQVVASLYRPARSCIQIQLRSRWARVRRKFFVCSHFRFSKKMRE